jgi:hypothetical protein
MLCMTPPEGSTVLGTGAHAPPGFTHAQQAPRRGYSCPEQAQLFYLFPANSAGFELMYQRQLGESAG